MSRRGRERICPVRPILPLTSSPGQRVTGPMKRRKTPASSPEEPTPGPAPADGLARLGDAMTRLASEGADAAQIADVAVRTWQDINSALVPIVGQHGSSALHDRSRHMASGSHTWLSQVHEDPNRPGEFAALRASLLRQSSITAAAATHAQLRAFRDVLARLVGESLTENLLRGVWDQDAVGNRSAEDNSQ